jgi:RNA polymerase sigma-70 factor (ECF subfamily)
VSATEVRESADQARPLDVAAVYAASADFVWATLQRLGVRPVDLDDVLQEVFVVVHQRLHTFDTRAPLKPWLFGICLRVAAAQRRRAHVRREQSTDQVPEGGDGTGGAASPEDAASDQQARARLRAILDEMDLEKRVVFVMYEIDEVPADEIAAALGIPFNTVHSRLRAARKQFNELVARARAREAGDAERRRGR